MNSEVVFSSRVEHLWFVYFLFSTVASFNYYVIKVGVLVNMKVYASSGCAVIVSCSHYVTFFGGSSGSRYKSRLSKNNILI